MEMHSSTLPYTRKEGGAPKGVRGLIGFGGTLENFLSSHNDYDATTVGKCERLILLCVHSHARLVGNASIPNMMSKYNNIPITLASLLCCPKFQSQKDVGRAPGIQYDDDCVFFACRRVEVWNFDYDQCIDVTEEIA